ncbi:hypothetical protein MNBD_CHLOROFLEXI01-1741 [hydrothermal vent metagenome]|uniref:Uncharacterized protein n=1 Tax=hydrothermal vent metagenome TaxID=652676 RepID=A0A3B0UWW3_9ZZZZ
MSDDPLTNCLECSTENSLRKVLNSVGIVFKGSGFYITDNRGKKKEPTSASNGKGGDNGDGAKTETAVKEKSNGKAENKKEKPVPTSRADKKA